ncbi:MAG TPA: ABC transporter permease [Drouetiella sp.]
MPEIETVTVTGAKRKRGAAWLFVRMAFQNLMRRPTRTFMLIFAVALGTGAVFASFTVARGIESSMQRSFSRMGADLIVVPQDAMVNITSALLTVQPTESTFDAKLMDDIAHVDGVFMVAPQTIYKVSMMAGMPMHKVNLIAFDPEHDFTVMPWLQEKLPRPMKNGDLICGGRLTEKLGDEVEPCSSAANIYGKLGRSGVGPFDESYFTTYSTVESISKAEASCLSFQPNKLSAILVRIAFGATPEQVKFALAKFPGVKVITGATIVTSTRQTTTALLNGMVGFTVLMVLGSLILLSLLFSAIITERKREVGLLKAIGARHHDIVRMLVAEAAFATAIGGASGIVFGAALLLCFQHSLVYYLETLHIEFVWPAYSEIGLMAAVCAAVAIIVGIAGAFIPAWEAGREQPFSLIQGENN